MWFKKIATFLICAFFISCSGQTIQSGPTVPGAYIPKKPDAKYQRFQTMMYEYSKKVSQKPKSFWKLYYYNPGFPSIRAGEGGYIYVCECFDQLNESVQRFFMAHEISHIAQDHLPKVRRGKISVKEAELEADRKAAEILLAKHGKKDGRKHIQAYLTWRENSAPRKGPKTHPTKEEYLANLRSYR